MLVICPIHDRAELLPHFLQYYTDMGATEFVFGLYNGPANPNYAYVKSFDGQYRILIIESANGDDSKFNGHVETNFKNGVRLSFKGTHEWCVVADLDKFVYWNGMDLYEIADAAQRHGCDAVHGKFVDRFPETINFPAVSYQNLQSLFPMACLITEYVGCNFNKISIQKTKWPIVNGHHSSDAPFLVHKLEVHHFKWTKGIMERLRARGERYTKQGLPWAPESEKFIQLLKSDYREIPEIKFRKANRIGTRPIIPKVYSKEWQASRSWTHEHSQRCLSLAFEYFGVPTSMLDIGCGDGHLVRYAQSRDVFAMGFDVSIPFENGHLQHADLRFPIEIRGDFRMVLCWELAEHLPEWSADNLCDTLVAHLQPEGILLFTAATPGQGGHEHVNEQPRNYWVSKFRARGLELDGEATRVLSNKWFEKAQKTPWYGANLMVFHREQ